MVRTEFPDLGQLKSAIRKGMVWPSLLMNVKSRETERNGIAGPFSIFLNLKGNSEVRIGKKSLALGSQFLAISQAGQEYDLAIPQGNQETETANWHIGPELFDLLSSALDPKLDPLSQKTGSLLQHQLESTPFQRIPYDAAFYFSLKRLQSAQSEADTEEAAYRLFQQLVRLSGMGKPEEAFLQSGQISTRIEILSRLNRAREVMLDTLAAPFSLENLAQEAALSRFHFLRLFREAYGLTPLQFVQQARLNRAEQLIAQNRLSLQEIAWLCGYENPETLSRLFRKQKGYTPTRIPTLY